MKYNFLIVDDAEEFRALLRVLLEKNYSSNILEASDKEQACTLLKNESIDLIIMDLMQPKGEGFELLKEIRLDPKWQYIPIILVTEFKNVVENAFTYEYVQRILHKPVYPNELIYHINLILHENKNPDIALLKMGTETQTLDYKKDLDLSTKQGRASLAKDVIAMANNGGGRIVIGVAEKLRGKFELFGLSEERLQLFETSLINKAIRDFISPSVAIIARRVHMLSKVFIFIEVPESGHLVMAARQNEEADLYLGRVYIRTHAAESAEVHDSADVQKIIDRLVSNQIERKLIKRHQRKRV